MSAYYHALLQSLSTHTTSGEARSIALLVLEKSFGVPAVDVYADKVRHFSPHEETLLQKICERLAASDPVQYVIGQAEFCGRDYMVRPGVLIPRPETEDLVQLVLSECCDARASSEPFAVLDVGTGSGCIACSIALVRPDWQVEGWDISTDALSVAAHNNETLRAGVMLREQNLFEALSTAKCGDGIYNNVYDVIVSNPPYVRMSEQAEMEANVLCYEPHEALFVPDSDPLLYYRALGTFALIALRSGGLLAVEINSSLGSSTCELLRSLGFADVSLHRDRYDAERMITCRR